MISLNRILCDIAFNCVQSSAFSIDRVPVHVTSFLTRFFPVFMVSAKKLVTETGTQSVISSVLFIFGIYFKILKYYMEIEKVILLLQNL